MGSINLTAPDLNRSFLPLVLPFSAFCGFLSLVGLVGNLLVFYIYLLKYPLCNFRYFVLYLCAIDLVCCIIVIPGEILTQVKWFVYNTPQICAVKSFFQNTTVIATSSGLLLIAFDRFLKVRWPLGRQITPRRARILTIVCFLGSCIFASPVAYLWGENKSIKKVNGTVVNVTLCEKSDNRNHSYWIDIYTKYCYVTPNSICMGLTILLYIFIGTVLIQRRKAVYSSSLSTSKKEVRQNRDVSRDESNDSLDGNHQEAEVAETSFSMINGTIERSPAVTAIVNDTNSDNAVRKQQCTSRDENSLYMKRTRWKKKLLRQTLITFITTIIFVLTMVIYQTFLIELTSSHNYLQEKTDGAVVEFLILYCLFYINCVINPFLYGFLDRRFQKIIKQSGLRLSGSVRRLRQRVVRK